MSKTVAYLGPPGTFSQQAVINHFGDDCNQLPCVSIDEVFSMVEIGNADLGVVPIENSTEGIVNNTQDCLIDSRLKIVGEEVVSIDHHFLIGSDADGGDVSIIASHQQSLAQCRSWINAHYPDAELLECPSNADAASKVETANGIAAIAGAMAAKLYGLKILERGIQDQDHNSTRFVVLSRHAGAPTGKDKTSMLIYTANKPGALFRILEPFENLGISLTKIDSRPSKKEAWEYVFFIDFEGHEQDEQAKELLSRLDGCTEEIKVIGSYPAFNAGPQ